MVGDVNRKYFWLSGLRSRLEIIDNLNRCSWKSWVKSVSPNQNIHHIECKWVSNCSVWLSLSINIWKKQSLWYVRLNFLDSICRVLQVVWRLILVTVFFPHGMFIFVVVVVFLLFLLRFKLLYQVICALFDVQLSIKTRPKSSFNKHCRAMYRLLLWQIRPTYSVRLSHL